MTQSLTQIIEGAKEELQEQLISEPDMEYPEDRIHEITDGTCLMPDYRYLDLAAANNDLATSEPECGPAFDGTATPINIICANLYQRISQELFELLYEIQQEAA